MPWKISSAWLCAPSEVKIRESAEATGRHSPTASGGFPSAILVA